ncbi:hypothetical protein [Deinococcus aestuarii]|uniref:hypothetical protein n=1 Tax=Deinococcus aestuarii TaxID=2774531 RepID=UPI001C0E567A|nr:hypothetical protein [Deinococcus aestuarii]
MTGIDWLQNIHWLVAYFAAGWLLGWLAVRERRWAVLPALSTVVMMVTGFSNRLQSAIPISSNLTRTAVAASLGLMVLWGASRLPALSWRVGVGTALVPVVVPFCFWLGFLLFLIIFQIP